MSTNGDRPPPTGSEIAIVGMACRVPGARNVAEFWRNVRDGVESIRPLRDDEVDLPPLGPDPRESADFVNAAGVLEDVEAFDAGFFGYTPAEAAVMDPQQRLVLECAWEALEHAGCMPDGVNARMGVFAGARANTYIFNLTSNPGLVRDVGAVEIGLGNDPGFLATRVSHRLGLTGPSYAVHSACSTSLVAVHLACQSLLIDECRVALAGGVSVMVPHRSGYVHQRGGILSPDGHCRPFDAAARGTVFSSGVGLVVLKRLEDARADGDRIHAVILGSAINNDGALKAGFTAPSVDGQADVIAEALASAGVDAETIGYVEAHGTGTVLGDPIEVRALTKAFGARAATRPWCALGTVKSNIGHLDAAAGVVGLIKTVLALTHRTLPPSLNYHDANPHIDFDATPFFVNTAALEWPARGDVPRRAGVSSFGVGGTNVHVVVEEPPAREPVTADAEAAWHVIPLSARSERALDAATDRLVEHLQVHPEPPLADVAWTLQTGRRAFTHRRVAIGEAGEQAIGWLAQRDPSHVFSGRAAEREPSIAFLFPGQGTQRVGMGVELYAGEPVFRAQVDACAEQLREGLGLDLRELLYPEPARVAWAAEQLQDTAMAQPALFAIEYALAALWRSWGIEPHVMIGHSLGEFVAACVSGVLSLEDGLTLVRVRGQLMREWAQPGGLVAVPLSRAEVEARLGPDLWLAAVNAPTQCAVAGREEALAGFVERLAVDGVQGQRLPGRQAFHSGLMDEVVPRFVASVRQVARHAPRIPYVSGLTGQWVTAAEVQDPEYWGAQLRQPVLFESGLRLLLQHDGGRALVEVGPGRTLLHLSGRQHTPGADDVRVTSLDPRAGGEREQMARSLGRLWIAGAPVRWSALHQPGTRQRVDLPTYPFERERHWIDPRPQTGQGMATRYDDPARWTYIPGWTRLPPTEPPAWGAADGDWLIFEDDSGIAGRVSDRLLRQGCRVVRVHAGDRVAAREEGVYTIDPSEPSHYDALLAALADAGIEPDRIAHGWSIGPPATDEPLEAYARAQRLGFYSVVSLVQALGRTADPERPRQLWVVTSGMQQVIGDDQVRPETAAVLGPCQVVPQETPSLTCTSVDVSWPTDPRAIDRVADQLCAELEGPVTHTVVALRGTHRWTPQYEAVRRDDEGASRLLPGGVYLVTGGLGGVGFTVAARLARAVQPCLVIVGRAAVPPRDEWTAWAEAHPDDPATARIARLRELEALGAEVLYVQADVSDVDAMAEALRQATRAFGPLNGVVHAAGVAAGGLTQFKSPDRMRAVFDPKIGGLLVLMRLLADAPLDFLLVFSSISAVLGEFGQVEYCAANALCDAMADAVSQRPGLPLISVNWDTWKDSGMAARALDTPGLPARVRERLVSELDAAMSPADALAVFDRLLAWRGVPRVVVSTRDLPRRIEETRAFMRLGVLDALGGDADATPRHGRPELATDLVPPEGPIEEALAEIWQHLLGIDRVGRHDSFFDLGGHSLLMTRVLSRVRDAFATDFPIQPFFEDPTVAGMARVLTALEAERTPEDDREIAADPR